MRSSELPTFEVFTRSTSVAKRVSEFNSFQYEVQYPPKSCLVNDENKLGVLSNIVDSVVGVLEKTGVQTAHRLQIIDENKTEPGSQGPDIVGLQLEDDRFGFKIRLRENSFSVSRDPSGFENFYQWYRAIMPEISELELASRRHIERVTRRQIKPAQAQYHFRVLFSDFRSRANDRSGELMRNVDVLESLIPSLPAKDGNVELSKQEFFRLDLTMSRLDSLVTSEGDVASRNCWYKLEAPFNENGRFIVLTANMRNSSQESIKKSAPDSGELDVEPMDDNLAGDVDLAINQFFRDKALEEFMGRVLLHWDFGTQRRF